MHHTYAMIPLMFITIVIAYNIGRRRAIISNRKILEQAKVHLKKEVIYNTKGYANGRQNYDNLNHHAVNQCININEETLEELEMYFFVRDITDDKRMVIYRNLIKHLLTIKGDK